MLTRSEALISLTNAGVQRGRQWLVRGVDLKVHPGEIVTLIGPNGSGKSTTAKMALGLLSLDEGARAQSDALVVGYVPQKLAIDWTLPLTVDRFMTLTGRVAADAVSAAMTATGVAHLWQADVCTLSAGEFQRVMLARAMARKPDLLVLDEPVQGVDFNGEIEIYELIQKIREDVGCGVLLISHDLHVVMAATDRVLCLNGHICCQGTPVAVASSVEYQRLFGLRSAQSLAVYQHHHDHTHMPDGRVRHADGSITDHCHPDDGSHDALPPADHVRSDSAPLAAGRPAGERPREDQDAG